MVGHQCWELAGFGHTALEGEAPRSRGMAGQGRGQSIQLYICALSRWQSALNVRVANLLRSGGDRQSA